MYWLRSVFSIKSKSDLNLLSRLYASVQGELKVYSDTSLLLKIDWQLNPFNALLSHNDVDSLLEQSFEIHSRLVGPQTVMAVAGDVPKITSYDGYNNNVIAQWADYIDKNINSEMNRIGDMCIQFKYPDIKLSNMDELFIAIKLSKYATLAIPAQDGYIVTNPKSHYLSWVGLNENSSTSLQFDKDDGFNSSFGESSHIDYLNINYFNKWKSNNFNGKLSDYFTSFS